MNSDPHPLPKSDRDATRRLARYFRSMLGPNQVASHFQDREKIAEAVAFLEKIARDDPPIRTNGHPPSFFRHLLTRSTRLHPPEE